MRNKSADQGRASRGQRTLAAPASGNEIAPPVSAPIILGDIELNSGARTACCGQREIDLTSVEFDLLALFLKAPGQVLARKDMVSAVLRRELAPFERSIDVHVSNLRKKLGPAPDGGMRIKAIRGVGYFYVVPPNAKAH